MGEVLFSIKMIKKQRKEKKEEKRTEQKLSLLWHGIKGNIFTRILFKGVGFSFILKLVKILECLPTESKSVLRAFFPK